MAMDTLLARGERPAAATVQRERTPPLTEQGKNTELLSQTRNIALYREYGTLGKATRSERRRGNVTPRSQRRDAHAVNANKADKSAADAIRLAENTRRMSAIARQNRRQNARLDETYR
jgi:hypothetical protein